MRNVSVALALVVVAAGVVRLAAEEPATPPAAEENVALHFARLDAERAARILAERQSRAKSAADQLVAAQQEKTAAQQAVKAAEQALAESEAALKKAEEARQAAEKAAAEATAALKAFAADSAADADAKTKAEEAAETAAKAVTDATAQHKAAVEGKQAAQAAREAAAKRVEQADAAIAELTKAKSAADKAVADLAPVSKSAAERLAALAAAPAAVDPAAARLVHTFTYARPVMVSAIDPSGEFVFGGTQDNSIQRWDLLLGEQVPMEGHRTWISSLAFEPKSSRLYSGGFTGRLYAWEAAEASPKPQRTIEAHRGQIRSIAFSPDGAYLATAGNDRTVRIWNTADGTPVSELTGHENHVYDIAFHPDGKHLVSGDLMGVVKQWEVGTWKHVRDLDASPLHKYDTTFQADCGGTRDMDFSPDGKWLAIGGIGEVTNAFAGIGKPTVLLFDWESGELKNTLKPKDNFQGSVWGVRFHPSGEFLIGAGGGGGGGMWFWKPTESESIHFVKLANVAYGLAMHPDGLRLAVPLYNNSLAIYDLAPEPKAAAK